MFRHLRAELDIEVTTTAKKLPFVPTEEQLCAFYAQVWRGGRSGDIILIRTFMFTGVRVVELVAIRADDVDLDGCRTRITGGKDCYVPFPATFAMVLKVHIDGQRTKGATHLFESSWKKPYSDRRGTQDPRPVHRRRRDHRLDQPPQTAALPVHPAQTQGVNDAHIQPCSGHATRQSLEIYSKMSLATGQHSYDTVIDRFPV